MSTHQYIIRFTGRENGAIGVTYLIEKVVTAENRDNAVNKLYDTHEHISVFNIDEMYDGTNAETACGDKK